MKTAEDQPRERSLGRKSGSPVHVRRMSRHGTPLDHFKIAHRTCKTVVNHAGGVIDRGLVSCKWTNLQPSGPHQPPQNSDSILVRDVTWKGEVCLYHMMLEFRRKPAYGMAHLNG